MADLGTDVAGIGAYLSTRRLVIPEYQRSYSWGPEGDRNEIQDLWDDVARAISEDQADYFLGAVVTIRAAGNGGTEVIDGQQRLGTASLLYAAMRDVFIARSDERAKEIESKFLGEKSFGNRALTQYLTLNADDNDYFRQLTLVSPPDRALTRRLGSHERLQYAYDFFLDKFNELANQNAGSQWAAPIVAWYEYMWKRALVLEVSVPNESRGFVIFETLNDRGLNLSTADLLKNHLFGRSGDRLDEVKARWARAMAPFEDIDRHLDVDTFLRHFWASRKGVVRVKGLFTLMKPDIQTSEEAVQFADDLQQASRAWTSMFDVSSDYWTGYSAGSLTALETLRSLNVEQCRPLVLSALLRLQQPEVERLLLLVVNWSVRWIVVGGGSAGTTERLYAETARDVTNRTITNMAGILARFGGVVPSDVAFQQAFDALSVRRGWLARYLLRALERQAQGIAEPELVPNNDVNEVNLEHVLPKSPDAAWLDTGGGLFSSEEAAAMVFLLGNQCLMPRTPNSNLGNKPFAVKKPELSQSQLTLTREIGAAADWDPEAIRTRQTRLAALAPGTWVRQ